MQIFIKSAQPSSWLLYSAVAFMQRGQCNVRKVWKQKLGHIKSQSSRLPETEIWTPSRLI